MSLVCRWGWTPGCCHLRIEDLKFRIATLFKSDSFFLEATIGFKDGAQISGFQTFISERLNFRSGVLKLPFYVGGSFLENQTRNREMQPSWKFQPREVSFRIGGTLNGGAEFQSKTKQISACGCRC